MQPDPTVELTPPDTDFVAELDDEPVPGLGDAPDPCLDVEEE